MADLLMLHRRTKIDDLIDSIPKPPNSVPINALPGWDNVPLSCKLPMLRCPPNSIIFTRNRLSKKLDNSSAIIFRLTNAFGQTKYEPLHDPNLRKYLHQEQQLYILAQQGQITRYKDVICTLKEFNEYRQYLNEIRLELVNREREKQDDEAEDRLWFNKVQQITEKNFRTKLKLVKRQINLEEREAEARQKLLLKQAKKEKRNSHLIEEQEKIKAIKQEIKELKEIDFRERLSRVNEARRLRVANLKHKMRLRDSRRIRNTTRRRQELLDAKVEQEMQEWCNIVQKRHEQQIHNANLLSKYETDMKNRIEKRIWKFEKIRERVQHKILQTKVNLIRSRYENMELQRLLQVVTEEIHRKVKRERAQEARSRLTDNTQRAGLSPIVAPYRTPEESEYGLGDPPSGYSAIDDAEIKEIVTTCARNEKILNGKNYTTMEVLVAAKNIFDRLAGGATDDLPNDPDVLNFVLIIVDGVISRVKERIFRTMVNVICAEHSTPQVSMGEEVTPKVKSTSTLNRNKSSKISAAISFKDPCDKCFSSKTKSLVLEKMASLRTMVRSALETPSLHDDLPIPIELEDERLFHLSEQQKILIVRNLHNLEIMLAIRLEQNVVSRFEIQSLTIKPTKKMYFNYAKPLDDEMGEAEFCEDPYNDLIGRALTSILTKPESDREFPNTILYLSEYLAEKILLDLRDYLECNAEGEAEEAEAEEEQANQIVPPCHVFSSDEDDVEN